MSNREGLVSVGDTSGKSMGVTERSRMRAASFNGGTVSAKKQKKRSSWVDVFLGERSRRGPRQGF